MTSHSGAGPDSRLQTQEPSATEPWCRREVVATYLSDSEEDGSNNGMHTGEYAGPAGYNKASYEVLRLDKNGRARQIHARRRDLLKEHKLQPRDLRRIDPSVDVSKTPPSITVKDNVVLLCLGGVRAILTAEKALLFEPQLPASRKFLEVVLQHMQTRQQPGPGRGTRAPVPPIPSDPMAYTTSHTEYMSRYYQHKVDQSMTPPFELEVIESALMVATGILDSELFSVTQRVQLLLSKLPRAINPVNLEELRKVKGALVELEAKADKLRSMLEELMDDEDELRELNLSNRPRREERRRQRERERLERELERAREIKEEIEERGTQLRPGDPSAGLRGGPYRGSDTSREASISSWASSAASSDNNDDNGSSSCSGFAAVGPQTDAEGHQGSTSVALQSQLPYSSTKLGTDLGGLQGNSAHPAISSPACAPGKLFALADGGSSTHEQQQNRLQELRSKFDRARLADLRAKFNWSDRDRERDDTRERRRGGTVDDEDWISRLEGSEEDIQEAQEALEEMVEQEEAEQEVEEVEDLMEYYLQRASATQDEAERLLADARDLEESIGISLSARRFEVNRLELTLSIGCFAAAIGAMVAGIFGMNMRSMLETSVGGFWGVAAIIILGSFSIFMAIMAYTRKKRIL